MTTVRLEGEIGREEQDNVQRSVLRALRQSDGEVWLDLRSTRHLHYAVARTLVETARKEKRLHFLGATPYVRQILCLMGGLDAEVQEERGADEAA